MPTRVRGCVFGQSPWLVLQMREWRELGIEIASTLDNAHLYMDPSLGGRSDRAK